MGNEETARLMTIPGVGPVTVLALQAFAPPMESFRRGRDFSAWLRPRAAATHDRGQAEAGPDIEDGPARSQAAPGHGSHDRCSARELARRDHGSVAGRDAWHASRRCWSR